MATTHRSDLIEELEKALAEEAYDGGMGALSPEQFTSLVRTLAVTAMVVVESVRPLTDGLVAGGRERALVPACTDPHDDSVAEGSATDPGDSVNPCSRAVEVEDDATDSEDDSYEDEGGCDLLLLVHAVSIPIASRRRVPEGRGADV